MAADADGVQQPVSYGESRLNREQLRDRLLAPVYQWTRLGRQSSKLMVAASDVVSLRYRRLLRSNPVAAAYWAEVAQMNLEKVSVPIECAAAMASTLPVQTARFAAQTGEALLGCVRAASALVGTRSHEEIIVQTLGLVDAVGDLVTSFWQLAAYPAEVASAGVAPLLRQVDENRDRLNKR
ncbi:MAG TPA: hypothetical protein PK958_15465 [Rhodocyclaceae bacterium]|nr:hypothetical protein [Rhodocyclaceae bacterium]